MELTIENNRQIKPHKVAVKQYESGTTSLVFTRPANGSVPGYMYEQVDLRNYKAYAVTSINGSVDMTELTSEIVGNNLVITWIISEQTLLQAGTITYQIVFKENQEDGENTGVFTTYEAIIQNSASLDADRPIAANYPTILKQWLDLIQNLAGSIEAGIIYMNVGQTIPVEERLEGRIYYQIENEETKEGHFEDNLGKVIGCPATKYVEDGDFNKLVLNGRYFVTGDVLNAPSEDTMFFLEVIRTPTQGVLCQNVYSCDDNLNSRTFTRVVEDGERYGKWVELANRDLGASNMVVVTDVDGNMMANAVIGSEELYGLEGFNLGKGTFQTQLDKKTEQSDFETYMSTNNAEIDTINRTLDIVQLSTEVVKEAFEGHVSDSSKHVSPSDRDKWDNTQTAFPVGTLIQNICGDIPGWLKCDGATYNTADYPELSTALGATGSTFTVPDFRGKVMWGATDYQPAGSVIEAGLPNIVGELGKIDEYVNDGFVPYGPFYHTNYGGSIRTTTASSGNNLGVGFDASKANPIFGKSITVQPPAIAVNIFIKY